MVPGARARYGVFRLLTATVAPLNVPYPPRSLQSNLYPLVLQTLPNEATCVNACACTEEFLLDMQFATENRVSPLLDFCASDEIGQIFDNAQQGRLGENLFLSSIRNSVAGADCVLLPSASTEQDVDDIAQAFFKLLIAVFEHSYTAVIASLTSPRSITLLQRLLLITLFPGYHGQDETVSTLGLPIWSYLQEEIADNGIVASQSGFGDPRWTTVKDVFEALVTGLRGKIQFPPDDEYRSWPKGGS